jgi:hypothetical protein
MPVQPLPSDDTRVEELTFEDNSRLEIDHAMRTGNPKIYKETCRLAVTRRYATVVDAKRRLDFPQPAPVRSFK